jgi:CelD/BcsL family acetyltransferase involved in cellulose biosynthesis
VKIETHADPVVFDQIADEWNSLLDPARPEALFLRVEWQRLWWQHLGRGTLNVVTIRDDAEKLVGIAPWFIEEVDGRHTLQTIGCEDVTDCLDIMYAPDQTETVLSALVDYLDGDQSPVWEVMDLCGFPDGSPTLETLPRLAEAKSWEVAVSVQDVAPVATLPGDFDDYLMALDGKQRRELRRKLRRAEAWEDGVDWYTVGPDHDLKEEVDAFLKLMALSAPEKAEFLEEPGHRAFFEGLAEMATDQGWLFLHFLRVGDERVAGLFNLVYGDRVMVYNSGFNYRDYGAVSPGWVLFGYCITDAIEQGMKCYDFLRGGEDYKYRLGGKDTTVHRIVVRKL